jgi:hypothetical protein
MFQNWNRAVKIAIMINFVPLLKRATMYRGKIKVVTKHLQIQNKTKQNETKLVNHFDFGKPKQNKIILFLILVTKTKTKSKQNQPKQEQN